MLQEQVVALILSLPCRCPRLTLVCFKAVLHSNCESEALLAHSSAVPVSVIQRYQPTLFMFIHLPGPLCQQWMQLDLSCFWKADLHQPALIPRRGFSTQGILASIIFASTASTILGILPWNCCSPFLHPQWIPSKGQHAEIGEWLSFSKWGFSYQLSDFYFHWGRVQNWGAEVFQGEPVLDNPCFYASKCNKTRRKKPPN